MSRSSAIAIRCTGVSKRFEANPLNPQQGLRRALHALLPGDGAANGDQDAARWFWALREVSFEIPAGGVCGVLGGNGSGKSVLLKILARVTKPTAGRSEVYGSLGSILHLGSMLVPELTGRENIQQIGTLLSLSRMDVERRFDEIAAFAGLGAHLDSLVRGYSAGMQLRLAFAVFVHLDSDVLLIDEALSVADEEFRQRCLQRIERMAKEGRTIVIVSHELEMMTALCDRVIVLAQGRLTECGSAAEVLRHYRGHA